MRHSFLFFAFFFLMFGISCKHQQKVAQTNEPPPTLDKNIGGNNTQMSAAKAQEQSTFVQGCIDKSTGNYDKALIDFQQCISMNAKNAAANYEVAGIYMQRNQADQALKYAKTANDLSPDNNWYKLRYAEVLQQNGQQDDAVKIFKQLTDNDPQNTDFLFRYANALKKAGRNDDALKAYDRIEKIEGISDTLQSSRIAVYEITGDKVAEESALNALVKAFPEEVNYYYRLAEFLEKNHKDAGVIYGEMTGKFPNEVRPVLKIAENQKHSDALSDRPKAFATVKYAFAIPNDLDSKIIYLNTNYPITDSSKALSNSEKTEADTLCAILRRTHPDDARTLTVSGDYLYKEGKTKEASDYYHKAAALGQTSYAPWKKLLEINNGLKDDATQEKDCKQVLELFPTQPDAYFYLGMIQYNKQEYKNAISNLESAKDFSPENSTSLKQIKITLADAYRKNGNDAKADSYCEEILASDSTNLPFMSAYANSLCERNIELGKAQKIMLLVVQKEPSNASYLETLGWIEYKLTDYKSANQWMNVALTKSPDNARMNERMGDIQYRAGNKTDAMKYWKIAKAKGGTNPALERKIASQKMEDNE